MTAAEPLPPGPPETLRQRLLDAAERALDRGGPDALSVRRLAREAGISTMGIYTVFGGKEGLMAALYAEGFARLYRHAAAAEDPADPIGWLTAALTAYRRFALDNTGLYALCFGGQRRFVPVPRDQRFGSLTVPDTGAYPSYSSLMGAFAAGQAAGVITARQPADALAHLAWGLIHGLVSLEIAGYVDPAQAERRYGESVAMMLAAVRTDRALPGAGPA